MCEHALACAARYRRHHFCVGIDHRHAFAFGADEYLLLLGHHYSAHRQVVERFVAVVVEEWCEACEVVVSIEQSAAKHSCHNLSVIAECQTHHAWERGGREMA